jgi:hypothetical protein
MAIITQLSIYKVGNLMSYRITGLGINELVGNLLPQFRDLSLSLLSSTPAIPLPQPPLFSLAPLSIILLLACNALLIL